MRAKIAALAAVFLMVPLLAALNGVGPASAAVRTKITFTVEGAPIAQTPGGKGFRTAFKGKVKPARKGAKVKLQRKSGSKWRTVATVRQDKRGNFSGLYVAKKRETLRVQSKPGKTNKTKNSAAKKRTEAALTFGDNFNSMDSRRWETRIQGQGGLRQCASPAKDRVKVSNGKAVLSVKKVKAKTKRCKYGQWANGMIGTKTNYKYGYYAARVKFEGAPGMHGAFWLQGPTGTGAEIDVAEYFGAKSSASVRYKQERLATIIHYQTSASAALQTNKRIGKQLPTHRIMGKKKTPSNSYHVYAVKWYPSGYTFYVDGQKTWSTKKPHVSSAESQIILSLLTSDSELPRLKSLKNSTMKVDWVFGWGNQIG